MYKIGNTALVSLDYTLKILAHSYSSKLMSRAVPRLTQWSADMAPDLRSTATTKDGLPESPVLFG